MKQKASDYDYKIGRRQTALIYHIFITAVSVILFLTLFLNLILFPVHVKSDTMETDIARNSAVFVCPFLRTPKRGDVVYISRPDGYKSSFLQKCCNALVGFFTAQKYFPFGYTHNISGKPMLRRVLALPGDKIYMKDYVLYVKPEGENLFLTEFELVDKPYNIHIYSVPAEWDGMGAFGNMNEISLGKNEYFVLADNRIEGTDSRVFGPIQSSRIKGRAIFEYFPFNKLRLF